MVPSTKPLACACGFVRLWDASALRAFRLLPRAGFALGVGAAAACTGDGASSCASALHGQAPPRLTDDGNCCAPWSRPSDHGCAPRSWTVWPEARALGLQGVTPAVAVGPSGRIAIAWQESVGQQTAAVLARETESGFELTSPSAATSGHHGELELAAAGDGALLVSWRRLVTMPEVRAQLVLPSGEAIVPDGAELISAPGTGHEHEAIGAADGELLLVWNQGRDNGERRGVFVARRAPGSLSFERPAVPAGTLSALIKFSNEPAIARNTRGDALIAWYESVGEKLHTFVSERWGLEGAFSRPGAEHPLSPAGGDVENPEPAVAEDGSAAVVWRQVRADGTMAAFLATRTVDGAWTKPSSLEDTFSTPADFAWNTRVAFTPGGDLFVVWEDRRGEDAAVRLSHRAPRGSWVATGRAPLRISTEGRPAIAPVLAVSPEGGVVVVWRELVDGEWHVLARRGAPVSAGAEGDAELEEAARWDAPTMLSQAGLGDASGPRLAAGGENSRVVAAWSQAGRIRLATVE